MKKIAIFGAGGFGCEVACLIRKINDKTPIWEFIGFFDDGKEKGSTNDYGSILGGINELNNYDDELAVVIGIGKPKLIMKIVDNIVNDKIVFPNIISPDVMFLDKKSVNLGRGNIICSQCLISCNVKVGDFNIFNGFIPTGHDVIIGDFNCVMPNVKISGEVQIGNANLIGAGAVILQQIKIGNNTSIGGNSLIFKNTKDGMTYIGNPARILKY